jgi:hypothetical protein
MSTGINLSPAILIVAGLFAATIIGIVALVVVLKSKK